VMYGEGISREGDLIDLAINHKIMEKAGAWLSYKGERWQGRENVKNVLRENTELFGRIEADVKVALGMNPPAQNFALSGEE
jgi:recombination protein RecA